jgi:hypothetical protein
MDPALDLRHLPPGLLAEVESAAQEEQRPPQEMLREVIERGLKERRWERTLAYGQERARATGFSEDDIPRLIAESRQERSGD